MGEFCKYFNVYSEVDFFFFFHKHFSQSVAGLRPSPRMIHESCLLNIHCLQTCFSKFPSLYVCGCYFFQFFFIEIFKKLICDYFYLIFLFYFPGNFFFFWFSVITEFLSTYAESSYLQDTLIEKEQLRSIFQNFQNSSFAVKNAHTYTFSK